MVDTKSKISPLLLKEIKLFRAFNESELGYLMQLGSVTTFEAHSNIVIEGEFSWGLYLILRGVVGIFKTNKLTGDTYDIGELKSGNFFGEMSLIDDNPRSATVRAVTDCELFFISRDNFNRYLEKSKDMRFRFYEGCIRALVGRLRELDDNYVVSQYQLWKTALKKGAA